MADVFLGYGVKNVVIKLGGKGCYYKGSRDEQKNIEIFLKAHNIDAVDATGAGDCFVAGLASELIRGADVSDGLKFANACGAICTTAVGAGTAIKDRQQILNMIG